MFDPDIAEQLINEAERLCGDEPRAALHLAACLAGLLPDREYAHEIVKRVTEMVKETQGAGS